MNFSNILPDWFREDHQKLLGSNWYVWLIFKYSSLKSKKISCIHRQWWRTKLCGLWLPVWVPQGHNSLIQFVVVIFHFKLSLLYYLPQFYQENVMLISQMICLFWTLRLSWLQTFVHIAVVTSFFVVAMSIFATAARDWTQGLLIITLLTARP